MSESEYKTRTVEIPWSDLQDFLAFHDTTFDSFLDYVSRLHCGNELLMDVEMKEIQPLILEVTGDVSEARHHGDYLEDHGQETVWDMRRDEPEAFR